MAGKSPDGSESERSPEETRGKQGSVPGDAAGKTGGARGSAPESAVTTALRRPSRGRSGEEAERTAVLRRPAAGVRSGDAAPGGRADEDVPVERGTLQLRTGGGIAPRDEAAERTAEGSDGGGDLPCG
ncbi:hypothetical protein HCJ92_23410, partial [Streptomyces sp. ventii]|nr:hypothetical protein [Streptomyces spiramenti]